MCDELTLRGQLIVYFLNPEQGDVQMKVNKMVIKINNFDNAAMCDDPGGQAATILEQLARRIREAGITTCDGLAPRDSNGNPVGSVTVNWCEGDDGDGTDDDDEDDTDDDDGCRD